MIPHRTPCTESAYDRGRRLITHRTPCIESADDRADKRCTPCTPSGTSPRARTAPLWEGLSSASRPASPHHHHWPRPSLRARAQPQPRFRHGFARGRGATTSSSSRAPLEVTKSHPFPSQHVVSFNCVFQRVIVDRQMTPILRSVSSTISGFYRSNSPNQIQ